MAPAPEAAFDPATVEARARAFVERVIGVNDPNIPLHYDNMVAQPEFGDVLRNASTTTEQFAFFQDEDAPACRMTELFGKAVIIRACAVSALKIAQVYIAIDTRRKSAEIDGYSERIKSDMESLILRANHLVNAQQHVRYLRTCLAEDDEKIVRLQKVQLDLVSEMSVLDGF